MRESFDQLIAAVKGQEDQGRENHCILVHGNIYDQIRFGNDVDPFPGVVYFLRSVTTKKFPIGLTFDIFSGLSVFHGGKDEQELKKLKKLMGLIEEPKEEKKEKSEDEKMIEALKQANQKKTKSDFPINPVELFPALHQLFEKSEEPVVLIIDYADQLFPAATQAISRPEERMIDVAVTKWALSEDFRKRGHLVILVSRRDSDIHEMVRDRTFEIAQIRITKPDENERAAIFDPKKLTPEFVRSLAKATSGLSFRDLHRIAKRCREFDPKNHDRILSEVFVAKRQILQAEYDDVLEIMNTKNGFEAVGGLDNAKNKLRRIARAMREGNISLVPMGILFTGPPGTGKTIMAEAFAKEAGINFVKFRDIKSMWLGESERRMTRALNACRDMMPVVIFIDEFDQNQGQRGGFDGDSGVSRGLFKKMLEIMSDTHYRGKILFIMATNRPDLIDAAMKRPGRCDLRMPFTMPTFEGLKLICPAGLRQYPDMVAKVTDWHPYAKRCAGYTGADMVEVVRRAWEHANEAGRKEIIPKDMEWACEDYRPQMTDRATVLKMTLLALAECSSVELLPEGYEDIVAECALELTGEKLPKGEPITQKTLYEILKKS